MLAAFFIVVAIVLLFDMAKLRKQNQEIINILEKIEKK